MTDFAQKEIRQFENLELLAKQVVEGFIVGLHQSPFHGFSVEFAEHRLYNNGEDTKHIDWKVYARTDRLYTKKYLEETNLRCQILLDSSSSMYFPESKNQDNKLVFSAKAAASLMYLLKKQRDAYGLSIFDEQVKTHTPTRSNINHFHRLLSLLQDHLNTPSETKTTDVTAALHEIADNIHRRSLVVIFSDMFDRMEAPEPLFEALQHLKYNKHEVVLFHTVDKKLELDFKFDNRPYEFIDVETGERLKIRPNEVEQVYKDKIQQFTKSVHDTCLKYKIDYIQCDINAGFNDILQAYLVKRKKMRV